MKLSDSYDPQDRFGVPVKRIIDVMKAHHGLMREAATFQRDMKWQRKSRSG